MLCLIDCARAQLRHVNGCLVDWVCPYILKGLSDDVGLHGIIECWLNDGPEFFFGIFSPPVFFQEDVQLLVPLQFQLSERQVVKGLQDV